MRWEVEGKEAEEEAEGVEVAGEMHYKENATSFQYTTKRTMHYKGIHGKEKTASFRSRPRLAEGGEAAEDAEDAEGAHDADHARGLVGHDQRQQGHANLHTHAHKHACVQAHTCTRLTSESSDMHACGRTACTWAAVATYLPRKKISAVGESSAAGKTFRRWEKNWARGIGRGAGGQGGGGGG